LFWNRLHLFTASTIKNVNVSSGSMRVTEAITTWEWKVTSCSDEPFK
jgi:hypothetical protein